MNTGHRARHGGPRRLFSLAVVVLCLLAVCTDVLGAGSADAAPARPHPHRRPWPITITLKTVPVLVGVRFNVDGRVLSTGADGTVTYTANHDFDEHSVELLDTTIAQPGRRFLFKRWRGQRNQNQQYSPKLTNLPLRSNYALTAGFAAQYLVSPKFTDQSGRPLDPHTITSVTAKSSTGQTVSLPTQGAMWLDALEVVSRGSKLDSVSVSYALQSVTVGGANIVDAGRQQFRPDRDTNVTFVGQFFDLTVTAHDALFGTPVGDSVVLTLPDGSTVTRPMSDTHAAVVTHLPRGSYKILVKVKSALVEAKSVRLSRNTAIDAKAISDADLGVVLGSVVLIALGLFVFAPRRLRRAVARVLRRRHTPDRGDADRVPVGAEVG